MAEAMSDVVVEFHRTASAIPFAVAPELVARILAAPAIYVHGIGRCGLIMRTFTIRLAQLGLPVHAVGDASTPAANPGDLAIIGSGTGETSSVVTIAERARLAGMTLVGLTATRDSRLARIVDHPILIPGVAKAETPDATRSRQPPGSLFEQMLFCFLEHIVVDLAEQRDPDYAAVRRRHANLE